MCVIFLAINQHPKYRFILAANRDEFYERPTAQAHFWDENPNILAGKDLVYGGTWLGVTKTGRFAAVTNYRDPNQPQGNFSRGNLVKDFLTGEKPASDYLQQIQADKDTYTGFNLLVGELKDDVNILYYSNISDEIINLKSGIYGLSNHLLDTPWKKVVLGKAKLKNALIDFSTDKLFNILSDKKQAKIEDLPQAGIGIEREKRLSSIFIETENYGTRSSTVLTLENQKISFEEVSYQSDIVKFQTEFELK